MDGGTLLFLAGLALVDSTSIGTLVIPLWMLLDSVVRVRQFFVYLATVAVFYLVVGIVLTATAGSLRLPDARPLLWAQLILGVVLFVASFVVESIGKRRRRRGGPMPAERWWARLEAAKGSYRSMALLGLLAAGIEAASMLPYLAAIGVLTTARVSAAVWIPVLTGYVILMTVPAIALLGARLAAQERAELVFPKLSRFLVRHMDGVLSWVLGIIGFLLFRDAFARLDLVG